jgi:hypothetical protein
MNEIKGNEQLLTSWKEIAIYLSKGVRTVQRWERELGLPVRRPAQSRHIVLATTSELDGWVAGLKRSAQAKCCDCREELDQARVTISQLRETVARLEMEKLGSVGLKIVAGGGEPMGAENSGSSATASALLKSDGNAA